MRKQLSWHMLSSSLAGLLVLGLCVPAMALQENQGERYGDRDSGQRYGQQRDDQQRHGQQRDGQQQYNPQRSGQQDRQQWYGQRDDRQQQTQQDRQQRSGQQDRQQRYGQRDDRQQQTQQGRQLRAEPEGWIRIAVDRDNDGQFEAVETIYVYDLQVAQQRSQQRERDELGRRSGEDDRESRQGRMSQQDRQRRDSGRQNRQDRQHEVEGTVQELSTVRLRGHDDQFVFARVRTQEGRTARVLLGAKSDLRQLDLDEGDRVSVSGRPAIINNRMMLVAREVEANDTTVRPQPVSEDESSRQQSRDGSEQNRYSQRDQQERGQQDRSSQRSREDDSLQELNGEVLNTRTVHFRGHDEPFLVGHVRLESGQRAQVNFGPQSNFRDVDLEEGKSVQIKARRGRISGSDAWIAEEVQLDETDETVDIDI